MRKEWEKEDGHPDWKWSQEYQMKLKEKKRTEDEAFDKRLGKGTKNLICEYCKIPTIEYRSKSCSLCKKILCIYHERPEDHRCKGVDWEGLRRKKHQESEEMFNSYMKKREKEQTVKTLVKVFIIFIIILVFSLVFIKTPYQINFGKNCSYTLKSGNCASLKPVYCDDGKLVDRSDICGCDNGYRPYNNTCIPIVNCSDGGLSPDCSQNKPYQCLNGTLISNPSLCGCPDDYIPSNDTCVKIQRCTDGTIYSQCSRNQPLYCENGTLIEQASICGCPEGLVIESSNINGENCVIDRAYNAPATGGSTALANIYDIETRIHILINAQRNANGLSSLNFDDKLASIARGHSQDMANRGYFEHNDLEGHGFYWRYQQAGYNCEIDVGNMIYEGGENILEESGYSDEAIASTTVDGWMNSAGHRANILTPYWRNEGIGVYITQDRNVYVTEDFC
jgi:uncharacterized protein YkwD